MTEFEDYSCFGSTRSPLQPYVSCHECLQQSRFWVPGCNLCLPAVCDHLAWATIFAWPTGWSLYTGFTVYASVSSFIIGSGCGLSAMQHQAITCSKALLLLDGYLGTILSEIWFKIHLCKKCFSCKFSTSGLNYQVVVHSKSHFADMVQHSILMMILKLKMVVDKVGKKWIKVWLAKCKRCIKKN